MAFVKLDTGILNSTLWEEPDTTRLFLTALLMAEPVEITEPKQQFEVRELNATGFAVPPGWYGFVRSAGVGIIRRSLIEMERGLVALEKLGNPDKESRSAEFEGRRLVRVDGGFLVLNYMRYRDRDYTAAERQQRLRERKRNGVVSQSSRRDTVTSRVTSRIADADADTEAEAERPKAKAQSVALPDWIPIEAWQGYCEMRKRLRKPLTDRAAQLIVKKLERLRAEGNGVAEVLDQSVRNSWQDVFPIKRNASEVRHASFETKDYRAGLTENPDGTFRL